ALTTAWPMPAPLLAAIWTFTIASAHIPALTGARRTRLTSPRRSSRWRHDRRGGVFCRSVWGGAPPPPLTKCHTPPPRPTKIAKPRMQHNPAEIHLTFAGSCSDNRSQLCARQPCVEFSRGNPLAERSSDRDDGFSHGQQFRDF